MPRPALPDWEQFSRELGERVRELRIARGLTQEELAHVTGLSRNQIQNIENSRNNARDAKGRRAPGPGNPRLDTLWALSVALEVDIAYLLRGD